MLSVHYLEAAPVCDPVCGANEVCAAGGVCNCGAAPCRGDAVCAAGGVCNCGAYPCDANQVCNNGHCGMYLKLSDANKLINTELLYFYN